MNKPNIKRILSAGLLLGLALFPLAAQTAPESLSLAEAIRAAVSHNLSINMADIELRSKTRAKDLSFNVFYPSLTVSGTLAQVNEVKDIAIPIGVDQTTHVYSNQLAYTPSAINFQLKATVQEVFSFTSFGLIDKAALDWRSARISRLQAEQSITAAVRKIYYQLLVQDEAINLNRSRLSNAEERLRQAELQFKVGAISELVLQQARVNAVRIRPELAAMLTSRANALVQFQTLLGYAEPRPDLRLTDSLDPPQPSAIDWQAREASRIDLRQSELNISMLQTALRIQDLSLLPVVAVQYSLDPILNDPYNRDWAKSSSWQQDKGALALTVSWDLGSFLPGSDFWVKRAATADQLTQAQANALQTTRNARDEVANTQRNIASSYQRIEDLQAMAEGSKRIYELTEVSYKAGAGKLVDLQDAELGWQNSRMQVLNEQLSLMTQLCDLESRYVNE